MKMRRWRMLNLIFYLYLLHSRLLKVWILADANIISTILGMPSQCVHRNEVWPCKLSFTCWLQGGKHTTGCGSSKWLFSCCVAVNNVKSSIGELANRFPNDNKKILDLPQRIMLKRRNENGILLKHQCGIPKTFQNTLQKRIIRGRPAQFAEYPWQAHIRVSEYQCGGVLVSKNIIATAAHCIQQARLQDILVHLGELDTQNLGHIHEPLPVEIHSVVEKIIHPYFQFRMTQPDRYDVALLKLDWPTGFSKHIQPICLPQYPFDLIGRKGIIAGWGKTEASYGISGTNILQVANVPIISTAECIRWHRSKQINVEIFSEMFCAGHPNGFQDACLGDSGGPLILKEGDRYTLIGITSAGFGCGVDHQPGIYHNIQKTSKWIENVITLHS